MVLRLIIKNFPIIAIIIAIAAIVGCFFQTRRLKQSQHSNAALKNQIRSLSEYINQQTALDGAEGEGPMPIAGHPMRPVSPPSSPIPSEPDHDHGRDPESEPEEQEPEPEPEPEPEQEEDEEEEEEEDSPKRRRRRKKRSN